MSRWNSAAFDGTDEAIQHREQDDAFCKMLRTAIEEGAESCPIGVSTQPCTKKPVFNYQRPDNYH